MPLFVVSFVFGQTLELSNFAEICRFSLNLPFCYNRHLSSFPSLSPHLSFVTSFEFLPNLWWILAQSPIFSICQFREIANFQYCWSAFEVTAAMLVVKNKSICLLWEPNSFFMLIILEKLYCIDPQHCRLVSWLQTIRMPLLWSHLNFLSDQWWFQIRQFRKICHFRKTHNYRHASFVILF